MENRSQSLTQEQTNSHMRMSDEMEQCISECLQSYQEALRHIPHCLGIGGEHASPEHIQSLLATASICETSTRLMLLNSKNHKATCEVCAETLRDCAALCEKLPDEDGEMRKLAQTFLRNADTCERMASGSH